jgi:hypothetical protein
MRLVWGMGSIDTGIIWRHSKSHSTLSSEICVEYKKEMLGEGISRACGVYLILMDRIARVGIQQRFTFCTVFYKNVVDDALSFLQDIIYTCSLL